MKAPSQDSQENSSKAMANAEVEGMEEAGGIVNARPEAIFQRKMQARANRSAIVQRLKAAKAMTETGDAPAQFQASHSPSTPVVQRLMGRTMSSLFRSAHLMHPTIAGYAVNMGADWTEAENIYNLGVAIVTPDQATLANLLATCGGAGAVNFVNLTALMATALAIGGATINATRFLIHTAGGAAANLVNLNTLVAAAPAGATVGGLAALVASAGGGAANLAQLAALVTAVGLNGTVGETRGLVNAAGGAAANLAHVTALVTAAGNVANVCPALVALLGTVAGNGTIPETATLVTQARVHDGATNLGEIQALVTAAGNVANVCVDLTALVNAIAGNGTVAETTVLVTRALANDATTNVGQMRALVQASPANAGLAGDLTALLDQVAGNGTVVETTTLVTRTRVHDVGATLAHVRDMVLRSGNVAAVCVDLTTLVDRVAANGTAVQIALLIRRARLHNGGTTLTELDALVQASPVAAHLVAHLRRLVDAVGVNGTVPETTALVTRALVHDAAATLLQLEALVLASPVAANRAVHLRTLVDHVAGNGTIVETTALVTRAIFHNGGTTTLQVDALVVAGGNAANVCVDLTNIVDAVAANDTVPSTTAMVTQAVVTLTAGNIHELLPLINHDPVQNTPPRVQALLTALGAGALARFQLIEPKVHWFLRQAAPVHAAEEFDINGAPVMAGGVFTCNAWAHFYSRHSYEACNFGGAQAVNSMWPQGVNASTELNNSIALAVGNGLVPGGMNAQDGGTNRVGVAGGGVIAQLYPIGGNIDENFSLAEFNAIANLR